MIRTAVFLVAAVCVGWATLADWRGFNPRVPLPVRVVDLVAMFWFVGYLARAAWREF